MSRKIWYRPVDTLRLGLWCPCRTVGNGYLPLRRLYISYINYPDSYFKMGVPPANDVGMDRVGYSLTSRGQQSLFLWTQILDD